MDWLETNVKAIGYRLKGMKKWRKKSKKKIISSDSTTLYIVKQYQYTVNVLYNVEYYNVFLIWTSCIYIMNKLNLFLSNVKRPFLRHEIVCARTSLEFPGI